jgi:hypothetical protein
MSALCRADEEEPPEFFEFTADDYVRVVASHAQARQRMEAATLMTQRMREQEARRRAASLGPVPVRIHFPDALILQARTALSSCHGHGAVLVRMDGAHC